MAVDHKCATAAAGQQVMWQAQVPRACGGVSGERGLKLCPWVLTCLLFVFLTGSDGECARSLVFGGTRAGISSQRLGPRRVVMSSYDKLWWSPSSRSRPSGKLEANRGVW